jgi:hypothetical protein
MSNFAKPEQGFRPHAGPYKGKSVEEVVQEPAGRAWLAEHIPTQRPEHQRVALAWLSWSLQREVTIDDVDELAGR